MTEQMIPIGKIRPPEWNSRLNTSADGLSIDTLAASMRAEGQMNAVNVEGPLEDGTFDLIAGSRRVRAARFLDWKEIRATVDSPTEVSHRIVKNVVENLQRKDLTLFEQARACAKLREEKLKVKDIAEKTGLSEQYVSNLALMYKGLPTIVLKAWEEQHEAATFNYLRELTTAAKDAPSAEEGNEIVLSKWQTRVGLYKDFEDELAEDSKDPEGEPPATPPSPTPKETFKVSRSFYAALVADIKAAKLPGTPLAIAALRVIAGEQDEISGVFPSTDTQNAGKNVKVKSAPKPSKKGKGK